MENIVFVKVQRTNIVFGVANPLSIYILMYSVVIKTDRPNTDRLCPMIYIRYSMGTQRTDKQPTINRYIFERIASE